MALFEGLAGNIRLPQNLRCPRIIAKGASAIKDWGKAQPFQRFRISYQTEVVQVPILICNQVIQHKHSVQSRNRIRSAQRVTAVQKVPVDRGAVALFLRLHDTPCGDQLRLGGHKIFADAIRLTLVPNQGILHVRNGKAVHQIRGNHLVERLLPLQIAPALDETPFPVQNLPPFPQASVRGIIRRGEIKTVLLFHLSEQHISDVLGKIVIKEVDMIPIQFRVLRSDPVLIGETETKAPDK